MVDPTLTASFAAISLADLPLRKQRTWDPGLARDPRLLVPVDVRAMVVGDGETTEHALTGTRLLTDTATNTRAPQPFSDGDLVLYGASYMGINQILTAAQHPPGLKAIFPIIPAEDVYRDVTWHGGAIDAGFIPLWLGLVTALKIEPPNYTGSDPAEALKVTESPRFAAASASVPKMPGKQAAE